MMTPKKLFSRRDFLRISMSGLLAAGLTDLRLFAASGLKADTIIIGAPVLTVDSNNSIKNAIAIKDNRILAVENDTSAIRELITKGTKIIKLQNGCITPGMIDVHNHLVAQATTTINWVDLMKCNSAASVRETIADWIVQHDWPPGKWVRGQGYMWLWDKVQQHAQSGSDSPPLISRFDLDHVVEIRGKRVDLSRYPIYLIQLSGHYGSANALALINARIMNESGKFYSGPDARSLTYPAKTIAEAFSPQSPAFGSFFNVSRINGVDQVDGMIFHHYAMEELIARAINFAAFPRLDSNEMTLALKQRSAEFLKLGVTSIYDNNLRAISLFNSVRNFPSYSKPEERVRLTLYPYICHLDKGAFPAFDTASRKGILSLCPRFDGEWMRLVGYKLQIDAGTMTGFTWQPNRSFGDMTRGKLNLWEYQDFLTIVKELNKRGAQVSIHVAGDKALDWTLDAYEHAGVGGANLRHRIEHLICVPQKSRNSLNNSSQLLYSRAKDLGLVFCPQPGFILYYGHFFENAFGPGAGRNRENKIFPRVTHSVPFRSAVEAGLRVALSSDNPCVPNPSPTVAIWESVHRRTRRFAKNGNVLLDTFVYNHPNESGSLFDESVDFNQALRGHTIDAAYCGFEEKIKGSIEPGKLADIVLWNSDLRTIGRRIPVGRLTNMNPAMTIVDGKIAYKDPSAAVSIENA